MQKIEMFIVHIISIKKHIKMTRTLHFDSVIPLTSKPENQDLQL